MIFGTCIGIYIKANENKIFFWVVHLTWKYSVEEWSRQTDESQQYKHIAIIIYYKHI